MDCPKAQDLGDGVHEVDLVIPKGAEAHYHYAKEILRTEQDLKKGIRAAIADTTELEFGPTDGGRYGLKVKDFNKRFRKILVEKNPRFRSEVAWSTELPDPVWLFGQEEIKTPGFDAKDLFDFARLDQCRNAQTLWNIIASGAVRKADEQKTLKHYSERLLRAHWDGPDSPKAICSCVRDRVRSAGGGPTLPTKLEPRYVERFIAVGDQLERIDVQKPKKSLILGEVQAGNWALAYRDVGRLLAVRGTFRETPINLFVILVLHGCLSRHISTGTVNFENTRSVYEKLGPDVPIPTWIVGLDFDHSDGARAHPRPSR